MPKPHPRYTVTDTGETAELLDLAARAWPEIDDRRRLLLALARTGGDHVRKGLDAESGCPARQRDALTRAGALVDVDALLGDRAWR